MSEFAPERTGAFHVAEIGGRHCAVFATFSIPAPTRDEAIRRGRIAVARGAANQKHAAAEVKKRMIDHGKAVVAVEKTRDEIERAQAARRAADQVEAA